ncbi:hypothetical protein KBB48_00100 [Candidatus Shapirobacteria bacterium]|nr:hypothetical protein [Candidatus Shapirobacteria bacterium]
MEKWIHKIRRLSWNQLRALRVLSKNPKGIIEAEEAEKEVGLKGKALGGVFSSLARQRVGGENLIEAWGRAAKSRSLRWKLNERAISRLRLKEVIEEVLKYE